MTAYQNEKGRLIYVAVVPQDRKIYAALIKEAGFEHVDQDGNYRLDFKEHEIHLYTKQAARLYYEKRQVVPKLAICKDSKKDIEDFLDTFEFCI